MMCTSSADDQPQFETVFETQVFITRCVINVCQTPGTLRPRALVPNTVSSLHGFLGLFRITYFLEIVKAFVSYILLHTFFNPAHDPPSKEK